MFMMKTGLFVIMMFSLLIMPFADAQQFEKATFQENLTIIYDQKFSESVIISTGFETTSNDEIRISDETIEKINSNEKIKSVVFTNAGECVIGVTTEQQCIMINFNYEELRVDGGIRMVQESAKEMANKLINNLNEDFRVETEFHSVFIHMGENANELLKTSGVITGKGSVSATYVSDKSATDFLFTDLTGTLIPKEIREGGGFYNISKKMSKDDNSIISISIIRNDNSNLYILKVAQEIKEKSKDIASIDILENFGIDEISRTDYFDKKNVPLNSVIHLIIIPNENTKVNSISTHAITDLTKIENIMKKGWFLHSPAGETIDLRFLFGETKTISAKELLVETAPWDMQSEMTLYSVEDIEKKLIEEELPELEDQSQYVILGIIILGGIGAAIFYLKGYKPKH
jgi:hypothetical protein